jgi:hypothetical protein
MTGRGGNTPDFWRIKMPDTKLYAPPTISEFMLSDKRVRLIRGSVGSGKSSGMVMELLRRATEQAPDPRDGIRRTRFGLVRNTIPQLQTTTAKTVAELLRGIVTYEAQHKTFWIRSGDIESEWIMLPLDTPENVQRLLSLDLTAGWLSEFRELPPQILMDVLGRCGRYPSMANGGPTWHGVIGETNSFSEDSPWYPILEEGIMPDGKPRPLTWGYWIQPGARDPGAENRENLVPGYYEDLIANNTAEWVEQYVDNKITPSLSGEAVFRASFRSDFHVAKKDLLPVPGTIVVVGMDFGRNPAAVITQMDMRGRLVVIDELITEDAGSMGVEQFIITQLRTLLAQPKYARLPVGIVGDPSGISRGQIGEESVFKAITRLGFASQPAMTNLIEPRLRAVEKWLLQQRDGGAALLISPHCTNLIRAMQSRYRYDRLKDGQLKPLPTKGHPWSDIADALQYGVLGHSGNVLSRLNRIRRPDKPEQVPPVRAWT